jgi:hypothetical protein
VKKEIDQVLSGILTKRINTKEVNQAKNLLKILEAVVKNIGADVDDKDLDAMTRVQKLQCAIDGECSTQEINAMITHFASMSLMHRCLRQRKEQGKPIPTTQDAIQTMIQLEGAKLLSKKQKNAIVAAQKERMRKSINRQH